MVSNMTYLQKMVLEEIAINKSVNDILKDLDIDSKKLLSILEQLKNKGYEVKREYYSEGNIILGLNTNTKENIPTVHSNKKSEKFIVKSDTHYGSYFERPDLDDTVMNYAVNNGYHYMLHLGDFIDGISDSPNINSRFKTDEGQIKYALKRCPRDKSVIQFILLGNHDSYSKEHFGYNIGTIISKSGFDLVPIGFERGKICVGKDFIGLFHRIGSKSNPDTSVSRITFLGHTHRNKIEVFDDRIKVYVPSLSDINIYDSYLGKGFLTFEVEFTDKREISSCVIDHMVFDNKPIIASEFVYQFKKK